MERWRVLAEMQDPEDRDEAEQWYDDPIKYRGLRFDPDGLGGHDGSWKTHPIGGVL